VVFAPLDFIARLAALKPTPRVHLTRYHGVFAPHSRWRAQVTPAGRGSGSQVRVIACIEDPLVIGRILEHVERSGPGALLGSATATGRGFVYPMLWPD
jgi:hypothetical protein